jgi:hypothetical protein
VGDWYLDRLGKWQYDKNAPAPGVENTSMMPAVRADPEPDEFADVYEREDGEIYGRVDPDEFESYDEVDSRTVPHVGGPG